MAKSTVNISIGQGRLLVTPLQVARMMAAVANGTGLDCPDNGLAFPPAGVHDLAKVFRPKADGGRMDRSGEKNLNPFDTHALEAAVQLALIGRYYERIGLPVKEGGRYFFSRTAACKIRRCISCRRHGCATSTAASTTTATAVSSSTTTSATTVATVCGLTLTVIGRLRAPLPCGRFAVASFGSSPLVRFPPTLRPSAAWADGNRCAGSV